MVPFPWCVCLFVWVSTQYLYNLALKFISFIKHRLLIIKVFSTKSFSFLFNSFGDSSMTSVENISVEQGQVVIIITGRHTRFRVSTSRSKST